MPSPSGVALPWLVALPGPTTMLAGSLLPAPRTMGTSSFTSSTSQGVRPGGAVLTTVVRAPSAGVRKRGAAEQGVLGGWERGVGWGASQPAIS